MDPIQFAGTLDGASRKKDKSISIRVVSNLEMSTEDFAEIDRRIGLSGWVLFAPNEVQLSQIPDTPAEEELNAMTPSQEMRWLLKRLWQQNSSDIEWPEFYRNRMQKMNDMLKEKLSGHK